MKKHLKVLLFIFAATLAAGVFTLGACKGIQEERIVADACENSAVSEQV